MNRGKLLFVIVLATMLPLFYCQSGWANSGAIDATTGASIRGEYRSVSDPDRSEIMDVIYRYSYTIDALDIEDFLSLFAENCRWVAHLPQKRIVLKGQAELREHIATRLKYFIDHKIRTRHLQTNTILTRINAERVKGLTYITLIGQVNGESVPRLLATGYYSDELVKTENGWRFAVREAYLDQGSLPRVEK